MLRVEHASLLHPLRPATAASPRHGLLPREHGAWAQLAFPLATALVFVGWNAASVALSIATMAVFLAHEPLLILIGHRGQRTLEELQEPAWRRLLTLGVIAGCAGGAGEALSGTDAQLASALPLAMGAAAVLHVLWKRERSIAGEAWAAATLASCALPAALAGNATILTAAAISAGWAALMVASTLTVRVVIAGTRRESTWLLRLLAAVCALVAPAMIGPLSGRAALALIPVSALCVGLCVRPPHARALRQIGWTLAAGCAATFVLLGLSFR